jgi:hypothetical protein
VPNRIIRDCALASKKLSQVSAEAERLFWRLLMVADDFGRFQAEPSMLLSRCFPLKVKEYSIRNIERWYAELTQIGAITSYASSNGDLFGAFVVWNQRSRADSSKYPPPDDGQVTVIRPSCDRLDEDVDVDEDVDERSAKTDGFSEFWLAYPKKKNKGDAEKAWAALRPSPELLSRILTAVAAHCDSHDWRKDSGKWIPYPASWLRGQRWEDTIERFEDQDTLPPLRL